MSGEKMSFPKSIEEFIERHSFKDEEMLYTNGSELMPVFYVKQMVEHYLNEPMQEIVEKLEENCFWTASTYDEDGYCNDDSQEAVYLDKAIEIVKEVGGMNE